MRSAWQGWAAQSPIYSHIFVLAGAEGVCLVLGNESQGLSREAWERCQPMSIPMAGRMESLNVSHAGAILMFALSKAGLDVVRDARQYIV